MPAHHDSWGGVSIEAGSPDQAGQSGAPTRLTAGKQASCQPGSWPQIAVEELLGLPAQRGQLRGDGSPGVVEDPGRVPGQAGHRMAGDENDAGRAGEDMVEDLTGAGEDPVVEHHVADHGEGVEGPAGLLGGLRPAAEPGDLPGGGPGRAEPARGAGLCPDPLGGSGAGPARLPPPARLAERRDEHQRSRLRSIEFFSTESGADLRN